MDLLGDELVLRRPRDVHDYLTEETLGSYERYKVELLAETHAAFLEYSLSNVFLTTALLAALRSVRMEKVTADYCLACVELHCVGISLGFIFE